MNETHSWVTDLTGGAVVRFDRREGGHSRGTWLVDVALADGGMRELVVRRDTGDGPLSGTEISLHREGVTYRALSKTEVRIPQLVGVSPDGDALLVERAEGSDDLSLLTADEQAAVMRKFVEQLVVLHQVDVAGLDLPGFARPTTPEDHARGDLELWQRVFERHVRRPAPLWRWMFDWLRTRAPTSADHTVLCHGDVGPGNFLFHEGEVTALLDWEFAHVGDPMDDLAWLSIRGHHLGQVGDLDDQLRQYAEITGWKIDLDRLRYYQVLVFLRMAVSCLVALDRPAAPDGMERSTYLLLLPLLAKLATTRLADIEGVDAGAAKGREPLATFCRDADEEVAKLPILAELAHKPLLPPVTA